MSSGASSLFKAYSGYHLCRPAVPILKEPANVHVDDRQLARQLPHDVRQLNRAVSRPKNQKFQRLLLLMTISVPALKMKSEAFDRLARNEALLQQNRHQPARNLPSPIVRRKLELVDRRGVLAIRQQTPAHQRPTLTELNAHRVGSSEKLLMLNRKQGCDISAPMNWISGTMMFPHLQHNASHLLRGVLLHEVAHVIETMSFSIDNLTSIGT